MTGQLAFTHQRQRIMLEETELMRRLAGQQVDTYAFPDGRYEVRHKGVPLAYRVFDKDQRVACGVVTGRKERGAVLARIQELQAAAPPKPAVSVRGGGGNSRCAGGGGRGGHRGVGRRWSLATSPTIERSPR